MSATSIWPPGSPVAWCSRAWTPAAPCAESHRTYIGVDAFINPAEILDFLLGWFGIDLMGDDHDSTLEIVTDAGAPFPVWRDALHEITSSGDIRSALPLLGALSSEDSAFTTAGETRSP